VIINVHPSGSPGCGSGRGRDRRAALREARYGGRPPLGQAPPWWPENEAWPPPRRDIYWVKRRRGFMRRMAGVSAIVFALTAIGGGTVLSWLVPMLHGGAPRPSGPGGPPPQLIVAFAMMVLLMMALAFFGVMRRFGSPLGNLVMAAERVGSGDYSARLVEHGSASLRRVARSFNSMTEQLQSQDQQRRQLMADIAHELRTPLSVLQGRLEGLLDGVYPRDDQRMSELLEDTRVLTRLVDDLRTLANAEAGNLPLRKEPTDLGILLNDSVSSFSTEAREKGIELRVEERTDLPLLDVDPLRIREVLTNLLANAIRHTGSGGSIVVSAGVQDGRVEVTVHDTGAGIPPEELPRIFDRFYKGASSRGSGLGLTIARNLIVAHGGDIAAASELGCGTMIRFTLPLGPA
jgi:two-component system, OmpR family, sensor histidine kinase BaeS